MHRLPLPNICRSNHQRYNLNIISSDAIPSFQKLRPYLPSYSHTKTQFLLWPTFYLSHSQSHCNYIHIFSISSLLITYVILLSNTIQGVFIWNMLLIFLRIWVILQSCPLLCGYCFWDDNSPLDNIFVAVTRRDQFLQMYATLF